MGAESFFVSVISDKTSIEFTNDGLRKFTGYDECLILDWYKLMQKNKFKLKKFKDYFVIDSCIEFYSNKNSDEEGARITLIGCFSCYEYAINKMNDIIYIMSKAINNNIKVVIGSEIYNYDFTIFETKVKEQYKNKSDSFLNRFTNNIIKTFPHEFYKKLK